MDFHKENFHSNRYVTHSPYQRKKKAVIRHRSRIKRLCFGGLKAFSSLLNSLSKNTVRTLLSRFIDSLIFFESVSQTHVRSFKERYYDCHGTLKRRLKLANNNDNLDTVVFIKV